MGNHWKCPSQESLAQYPWVKGIQDYAKEGSHPLLSGGNYATEGWHSFSRGDDDKIVKLL